MTFSRQSSKTAIICLALDLDRPTAEQVLQKLGDYYAFERRGIRLIRIEDSYQLCSSPDYADVIRKAFEIAQSGRPGPVLIDIPKDVTGNKAEYEPVKKRSDAYQSEAELEKEFIKMLQEQGYEYHQLRSLQQYEY